MHIGFISMIFVHMCTHYKSTWHRPSGKMIVHPDILAKSENQYPPVCYWEVKHIRDINDNNQHIYSTVFFFTLSRLRWDVNEWFHCHNHVRFSLAYTCIAHMMKKLKKILYVYKLQTATTNITLSNCINLWISMTFASMFCSRSPCFYFFCIFFPLYPNGLLREHKFISNTIFFFLFVCRNDIFCILSFFVTVTDSHKLKLVWHRHRPTRDSFFFSFSSFWRIFNSVTNKWNSK